MRDPKRLDYVYTTIKTWHKNHLPDWRFMQLMINFLSWHIGKYGTDGFYKEDEKFLESFEEFMKDMLGEDVNAR